MGLAWGSHTRTWPLLDVPRAGAHGDMGSRAAAPSAHGCVLSIPHPATAPACSHPEPCWPLILGCMRLPRGEDLRAPKAALDRLSSAGLCLKAVGKVPQHRLDQPHPEQSMPILCHVWEKLLLSCLFSLSPLLFFHPESFKHEALGNSREFNTMQEVLYFFFVCSSSSLISSMFHSVCWGR